jgi:class 3 adenylate cyclase
MRFPAGTGARFCSQCGAPLVTEPPVETDAERRHMTVLFADLSGFTSMTARHDPEDVRTVVDQFLGLARATVDRWGGRVDQFLGDGLMAVFGDPVTREDDAERAVRAAIEIRDGTAALQHGFDTTVGTLESHLGVATGMAVTADAMNSLGVTAPLGTAVNLAARLQSLATSGEVLVCSATAARIAAAIETTSIGAHELKGLEQPTVVHRVDGVRRAVGDRRLTALVGRDREVDALTRAIEALVRDRSGSAVIVVAEAGAGKTRLVREVRRGAVASHGARLAWYEGRGSSLGAASPYAPVVEIIRAMAQVDERDDADAIRDRMRTLVTRLGLDGDDVLGPLLRLVGHADRGEAELDRESFQVRLARAVEAMLRSAAEPTAVVICVQDLHWVDPSTITLLRSIVPSLRDRVVFLFNTRPVDTPVFAGLIDEMRLRDLAAGDVAAIIASRLGGEASSELADLVYERAGGNAFFAEEVLNRLVDEDAIVPTDDGWALRDGAGHGDVPDTVQGVIAARLDLLPLEARTRLRHAAVFGREFTVDDLLGIDADHDPRPALVALERPTSSASWPTSRGTSSSTRSRSTSPGRVSRSRSDAGCTWPPPCRSSDGWPTA